MAIVGLLGGKRLDLHQQRRHEVEGHPNRGKLAEHGDHAPVVLDGVQSHPGQDVLTGGEVLVIRLVHVPQQGELRHLG